MCVFFLGGMIRKTFFAFDCTNAGVWDLCRVSNIYVYIIYSDVECGDVFIKQQNTKKLFKTVVRSMHHPKKETEIP